jgi:hypothetical protein
MQAQASAGVYLSSPALHRACDLRLLCLSGIRLLSTWVCPYLQHAKKRLWNLESTCARRELVENNLQLRINIQHRGGHVSRRRRRRPVKAVALPPRQRRAVV